MTMTATQVHRAGKLEPMPATRIQTPKTTMTPAIVPFETFFVSISSPSPSDSQAWVRVSKRSRGSLGRFGLRAGIKGRYPIGAWR